MRRRGNGWQLYRKWRNSIRPRITNTIRRLSYSVFGRSRSRFIVLKNSLSAGLRQFNHWLNISAIPQLISSSRKLYVSVLRPLFLWLIASNPIKQHPLMVAFGVAVMAVVVLSPAFSYGLNIAEFLGLLFLATCWLLAIDQIYGQTHMQGTMAQQLRFWIVLTGSLVFAALGLVLAARMTAFFLWMLLLFCFLGGDTGINVLRGRAIKPYRLVRNEMAALLPAGDPGAYWAGVPIPSEYLMKHLLVVGASGSGKTLTLNMFMQSVFPLITPDSGKRALLFDAKRDLFSTLSGMGLTVPIMTFNPFDVRCVAWDMAKDIKSDAEIQAVVEILAPVGQTNNEFFDRAVQVLLDGVITWFNNNAPDVWTFRDVVLAMRSYETLQQLLLEDEDTAHCALVLGDGETGSNVMATVMTKMRAYGIIAACWDRATKKVSLSDWVNESSILLLGEDEALPTALQAVNRLIFTRLAQLLLNKPNTKEPETFIVLDELPSLGKTDKLLDIATKGRSKGISLALGFQEIDNLRDVYTDKVANTIVAQCDHKAFLRMQSPETAKWATEIIGEYEAIEQSASETVSPGSGDRSTGRAWSVQKRESVLRSELMDLPRPTPRNGLSGYWLGDYICRFTIPGAEVSEQLPQRGEALDYQPAPIEHQQLRPWDDDDYDRLGLEWVEVPDVEEEKVK